jgi:4-amino-4-deoxy-L-arabinose transferase-like glycosyltransferase
MRIDRTRTQGWLIRAGVIVGLIGAFALLRPGPFKATIKSPEALVRIAALVLVVTVFGLVLRRFVANAAARTVIVAVPTLVVLALIVGPYFTDKLVEEALPTTVAALQNPDTARPTVSPVTPAPSPAAPAAPVTPTAPTAPAAPPKVTSGSLEGIDHRASGQAAIYRLGGGPAFVRLEDIDVQNGPDYVLYLVPGADRESPDDGISLGDLKGNQGSQNYELPDGVDLTAPHTVLIWCRAFSVPVANASQEPA